MAASDPAARVAWLATPQNLTAIPAHETEPPAVTAHASRLLSGPTRYACTQPRLQQQQNVGCQTGHSEQPSTWTHFARLHLLVGMQHQAVDRSGFRLRVRGQPQWSTMSQHPFAEGRSHQITGMLLQSRAKAVPGQRLQAACPPHPRSAAHRLLPECWRLGVWGGARPRSSIYTYGCKRY